MKRMLRVNELLKRELGTIFERRICPHFDCLITVTEVKTAPDLHHANVYVSVYGSDAQRRRVILMLEAERSDMQKEMSSHIRLKYTPVLHFFLDDHLDKADRIFRILDEIDIDNES